MLTPEEFDRAVYEISACVGNSCACDLFEVLYSDLLQEVSHDPDHDRRTIRAARLRRLLMLQAEYLMNRYLTLQRNEAMA